MKKLSVHTVGTAGLIGLLALAGCGGSGGGSEAQAPGPTQPTAPAPEPPPAPPPAAAIPDNVSISTAAIGEAGVAQGFTNSAVGNPGLLFEWDFGDGNRSTLAAPQHGYTATGDFAVSLRVSNSAGQSRTATARVSVNRLAHLQGLRCTAADQNGWCRVAPTATDFEPIQFSFVSEQVGWASGAFGEIRHTRDGGRTWSTQISGVANRLPALLFADEQRGWALAQDEQVSVLRTLDGGATWQPASVLPFVPGPSSFLGASLLRFSGGELWVSWAERPGNSVAYSTFVSSDEGSSWRRSVTPLAISPGGVFWDMRRPSISESVGQGSVYRSLDLGASFTTSLEQSTTNDAAALVAFDDRSVLVRYNGNPLSSDPFERQPFSVLTRDGGATWSRFVASGPQAQEFGRVNGASDATGWVLMRLRSGDNPYRVSFDHGRSWQVQGTGGCSSGSTLYHLGNGRLACLPFDSSPAWISADRGATWRAMGALPGGLQASGPRWLGGALTLSGTNPDTGVSTLFVSRDDGASWSPLFPGATRPRATKAFWALAPQRLLRQADDGFQPAIAQRSGDGGRNWLTNGGSGTRYQFVNGDMTGWLSGPDQLWRTPDGGQTWAPVAFAIEPHFIDAQRGWSLSFTLNATEDGGSTWRNVSDNTAAGSCSQPGFDLAPPVSSAARTSLLRFFDALNGFIVDSRGRAWVTRDGGRTCQARALATREAPAALARAGARGSWLLGSDGGLQQSTDRGDSWRSVDTGLALPAGQRWTAVHFLDEDHGWLAGTGGYAASTSDGGRTWRLQRTGLTRAVTQIQFIDRRTGWLYGEDGVVVGTGTGGS